MSNARGGKRTRSGPAPKPASLKALRGGKADAKGAGGARIPKGKAGLPECPPWLDQVGADLWAELAPQLVGMKIPEEQDGQSLALLCAAYEDFRAARDTVRDEGRTYRTETVNKDGMVTGEMFRPHPAMSQLSDAWRRVLSMMAEFGLTPSSRTKVKPGDEVPDDPLGEFTK